MQNDSSAAGRALNAHRRKIMQTCQHCGAEFGPAYTTRKYCSQRCRQAAYLERNPEALAKTRERARQQRKRRAAPPDAGAVEG